MSRSIRDTNGLREVSERVIRDTSNTARAISETWVRGADNALRQVFGGSAGGGTALTAIASPPSVRGAQSRRTPVPVSTNSTSITVSGGSAPYRYAWEPQPDWTIGATTSSQTNFTASAVQPSDEVFTTFSCTVTDNTGATALVSVDAAASNYGGGGVIP